MRCSCNPNGTCACLTPLNIATIPAVLCVDSRHSNLEAENARLRGVLTELARYDVDPKYLANGHDEVARNARAALEGKE